MQRIHLAVIAAMIAGCGDRRALPSRPAGPDTLADSPALAKPSAATAALADPSAESPASCPVHEDAAGPRTGWFDIGGAAPAPDGARSHAAASGGGLFTGPGLGGAAVALAPHGPVVAHVSGQGVRVLHLHNGRWLPLGQQDAELGVRGIGAGGQRGARLREGFGVSAPAMGVDAQGGLVVAWVDRAPPWSGKARAARWDGATWRDASPRGGPELGCQRWDVEFGAGSEMPWLHVSPRGEIWVACVQPRSKKPARTRTTIMPSSGPLSRPALEVRRWTGRGWQTLPDVWLGQSGTMAEVARNHGIALAADSAGSVVVLHTTYAAPGAAEPRWQALRWNARRRDWSVTPLSPPAGARFLDLFAMPAGDPRTLWLGDRDLEVRDAHARDVLARVPAPAALAVASQQSTAALQGSALVSPGPVALSQDGRIAMLTQAQLAVDYLPQVLRVHLWSGAAWTDEGATRWNGGVSRAPGASRAPALALDRCSLPVVAWLQAHAQGSDVYLRRFTGRQWEELGGSASGGGVSRSGRALAPAVTVDELGRPVILWWEQTMVEHRQRATARVRRFENGGWHDVGGAVELAGVQPLASNTALRAMDGRIIAATPDVQDGGVEILRWDGRRWTHEATTRAVANAAWIWPQIDADGRVLAVLLVSAASELRLAVWQDRWNVPRSVAHADAARLGQAGVALDAEGRIYLAWVAAGTWPGDVMVEVERARGMVPVSGSASDSEAHSMDPALAVGFGESNRVCVAWSEPDVDDIEIFVRCGEP